MGADRSRRAEATEIEEIFDVVMPPKGHGSVHRVEAPAPRQRAVPWRPFSLLAVAGLAAALVLFVNAQPSQLQAAPSTGPSAVAAAPTVTPAPVTPLPTPSDETASELPTLGPYWPAQIGLPLLTLPADAAYLTPIDTSTGYPKGFAVATGEYVYRQGGDGRQVNSMDFGGGGITTFQIPIEVNEMVANIQTDGTWLALLAEDMDTQCKAVGHWRILVAHLGAQGVPDGEFNVVARGSVVGRKVPDQTDCLYQMQPNIRLVNGRLAWAEERSKGTKTVVRVHDLATGRTATYAAGRYAVEVVLSSDAMAWVELPDPTIWMMPSGEALNPGDVQVREVRFSSGEIVPVDYGASALPPVEQVPQIGLDGEALVVTSYSPEMNSSRVVRVDGGVVTVVAEGDAQRMCGADGAIGGVILLTCSWPNLTVGPDGGWFTMPAVWTADRGLRVITVGSDVPQRLYFPEVRHDWLLFQGDQVWMAVPVSALTAP